MSTKKFTGKQSCPNIPVVATPSETCQIDTISTKMTGREFPHLNPSDPILTTMRKIKRQTKKGGQRKVDNFNEWLKFSL